MFEKRNWQNLSHQKCPNCDARLEDKGVYWFCPNYHEGTTKKCFVIHKSKVIEYLTDSSHAANRCLSDHEKNELENVIKSILNT